MKQRPPYDPAAYAAELEARCRRVGVAWSSPKRNRVPRLPPADEERRREALRLLDPDREDEDGAA